MFFLVIGNFQASFLQLHISERTGRGVPKITEIYGKQTYEFRENSILVSIPFTRVQEGEMTPDEGKMTYDEVKMTYDKVKMTHDRVEMTYDDRDDAERILEFCMAPRTIGNDVTG